MVNEIYVAGELVTSENPKSKFKNGYKIRCTTCNSLINRKWYEKKILETLYECKYCVLTHKNPMYNVNVKSKHSEILKSSEYRDNMRLATLGDKNGFYGKTHTNQTMDVIKSKLKSYWNTMDSVTREGWSQRASVREKNRMESNPSLYRKQKSEAAKISHNSQFRNLTMNGIETMVYDFFIDNGVKIEYSVVLASYQFDFGIKDKRLLIEVDGDYWHGNPKYYDLNGFDGKRKLNEIQIAKMKRDEEKESWAISRGFSIIRIWEDEIKSGEFKKKLRGYVDEVKEN